MFGFGIAFLCHSFLSRIEVKRKLIGLFIVEDTGKSDKVDEF